MKKIAYLTLILAGSLFTSSIKAQTQKGNVLVGSQLANIGGTFQDGGSIFNLNLTPQAGWFIKDDLAIGPMVNLGLSTGNGSTTFTYGVGAFGRYYIRDKSIEVLDKTRWFLEANVGVNGVNRDTDGGSSTNTNGLGVGFGPGLAYFVTPNIALEGLLKYDLTVGFGNSVTAHNVGLNLGFQIYLPGRKMRDQIKSDMRK